MKSTLSILFLICCYQALSQSYGNTLEHHTGEGYSNINDIPDRDLLADDVLFRTCPNSGCELIRKLPIGTPLKILKKTENFDTINGVISNWYLVSIDKITGYIWGGLIAQNQFGSSKPGGVKFVLGLEKIELEEPYDSISNHTYKSTVFYTEIQAFKDGIQLAKYSQAMEHFFYDLSTHESYGYGTADAQYSEGDGIIFPSHMSGEL